MARIDIYCAAQQACGCRKAKRKDAMKRELTTPTHSEAVVTVPAGRPLEANEVRPAGPLAARPHILARRNARWARRAAHS